jgi:hypothetical protein
MNDDDSLQLLRRLIWLYFWLLIFEGALRKWIFPQLSGALLIVRDPVALAIYLAALRKGVFPWTPFVWCVLGLATLCFAASFAGEGTIAVTLYGLRADFLHLPLIVVIPRAMRPEDVKRLGFALLATLPFMTALAILQFKGSPESRWNVGAGAEIGGQLYAAQGKVRASGTFSFVTGMASYLALCAAFLLRGSSRSRIFPRWLTLTALPAFVLTLAISGSRSAVLVVGIVCTIMLYMGIRRPEEFGAAVRPMIFAIIAFLLMDLVTPLVREGMAVQRNRFQGGGGLKEGIIYRYAQDFSYGWQALFRAPPLGIGLGIGTNAGSRLLAGRRMFILGESEWQRVIMESGPFLGTAYLALRIGTLIMIVVVSYRGFLNGQPLAMLLAGVSALDLINGQFGQPTALGFAVFTSGLALAAAAPDQNKAPPEAPKLEVVKRPRGQSRYAERLHGSGNPTTA